MENNSESPSPPAEYDRRIRTDEERLSRLRSMAKPAPPAMGLESTVEDAETEKSYVPGVVHVVVKEGVDGRKIARQLTESHETDEYVSALRSLLNEHEMVRVEASFDFRPPGLEPEENPPPGRERYLTLYFPPDQNISLISKKLRETGLIESAVPSPKIIPSSGPLGEPMLGVTVMSQEPQWYIKRVKADLGWQLAGPNQFFSGQGVVLADLDWGFLTTHEDFAGRIKKRYHAISGLDSVDDNSGGTISHGTAVLGLLGAGVNGVGMSGFAFGADLWAIQADNGLGLLAPFQSWVSAIEFVRLTNSNGRRKVICLEAETADSCNIESEPIVNKAIRDAIDAGIVVCVPAGNGNRDAGRDVANNEFTPTGSILVGATIFDHDPTVNRKAGFSNWGPRVVVSAPGDPFNDISTCAQGNNKYDNFGGTSGATPKVAGTVALMLEANPQLTHAQIRNILNVTGTLIADADDDHKVGTFLNVSAAIAEAQRLAAPPP
jgi:subtilisin family serine protease